MLNPNSGNPTPKGVNSIQPKDWSQRGSYKAFGTSCEMYMVQKSLCVLEGDFFDFSQ